MQTEHKALNELCNACGKYGKSECAFCIVEIYRQEMITKAMQNYKANDFEPAFA